MALVVRLGALLLALFAAVTIAVHPVEVQGQEFVDSVTKQRVMIVGTDYQPGGQGGYGNGKDPLSNGTVCLRDAILLQYLGANTIRVYNVDPTLNHDDCASIFNAAGIYMIVDVNAPFSGESINRAEPWTSYYAGYLQRIFGVVENFKAYPNTLAFFAANEVINDIPSAEINPPYIRAVQRDLKNYIAKHSSRTIPVGYSAADVREILQDTWAYMQCDNGDNSRSDFFGLNSYSWCGSDATFQSSGYSDLVTMFQNSSIPVFFSEYGCNKVEPRAFTEVQTLYGKQMTALSGGLVYEYSEEPSDYGLVTINDNSTVTLRTDFNNLQSQYNKLDIGLIQSTAASSTSTQAPKCVSNSTSSDGFSANFTLPNPPPGAEDLINNGIKNPVNGKLVDVSNTNAPYAVYGSNGVEIQNLSLKKQSNDASNTPNGGNTTLNGSTSQGSENTKKKGDASKMNGERNLPFALLSVALTFLCV